MIADLARIELDAERKAKMTGQISRILEYIDTLKNVDVEGVTPFSGAAFQSNVLREDQAGPVFGPETTLANAPEQDENYYIVPTVVK